MGYALIWVEGLALAIFVLAVTVAFAARWSWRFVRPFPVLLVFVALLALAAGATLGARTNRMSMASLFPFGLFPYCLAWVVAFFAIGLATIVRGLRRVGAERVPAARQWPRGKFALAAGTMAVLLSITMTNMDLALQLRMARAREETGTMLQALAPPPVPEQDNAAPLYRAAFDQLTPFDRLPASQLDLLQSWRNREFDARYNAHLGDRTKGFNFRSKDLKEFLASQEKGLALLRQAAAKPACRSSAGDLFQVPRGTGENEFSFRLERAMIVMALDARARAADGDARGALDDVASVLRAARQAYADVGVAAPLHYPSSIEDSGLRALEDVLQLTEVKPADLNGLPLEGDYPGRKDMARREVAYAALGLVMFSPELSSRIFWDVSKELFFRSRLGHPMPEGYEAPVWFDATVMPLLRVVFVPDALDCVSNLLRDSQETLHLPEMEPYARWLERDAKQGPAGTDFFYDSFKSAFRNYVRQVCDTVTHRRLARVAVALVAYKAAQGNYPEKLESLVPTYLDRIPADPWDDGEINWRHADKEWLLYTDRVKHRQDVMFRLR